MPCKSPQIQNELIHLIAIELQKIIVSDLNESSYLTLLDDEATDRSGHEFISIAFRYLSQGIPFEALVAIESTNDITSMGFSKMIIDKIGELGIKSENIISQCYDGASTMSGKHGGLQRLIADHYGREIPYVHCFNHKLHLVIEAVVLNTKECRLFFGEVRLVYDFFSRFKVRREYSRTSIPRLIETRWSGHLYAVQSIRKNYNEILSTCNWNIQFDHTTEFHFYVTFYGCALMHDRTSQPISTETQCRFPPCNASH